MIPLFTQKYGPDTFSLVEVPSITAPACYDDAVKGVADIIHTACTMDFSGSATALTESKEAALRGLEAAKAENARGGAVRRVVLTSSSWAVCTPTPDKVYAGTWSEASVTAMQDPTTPAQARGVLGYTASKTLAEQAAWEWMRENGEGASFMLNSILPGTCMGPMLAPIEQPYPSTAGFVRQLFEGKDLVVFQWLQPQWFTDVRDAAALHVAALVLEGVEGERVFGSAELYTWPKVVKVMEELYPGRTFTQLEDKGNDLSEPPRGRWEELLKKLGGHGWSGFEDAVAANLKSFYPE